MWQGIFRTHDICSEKKTEDDEFCPKESLNEYELQLFQHHIAFIETIEGTCYFMGYKLLK